MGCNLGFEQGIWSKSGRNSPSLSFSPLTHLESGGGATAHSEPAVGETGDGLHQYLFNLHASPTIILLFYFIDRKLTLGEIT